MSDHEKDRGEKEKWEYLITVRDDHEMNVVHSLLKAHDILVMIKHKGIGEYMSIVMGTSSIHGIDIFVPSDQLDKARQVLEAALEEEEGDREESQDEEEDPEENQEED